MNGRMPVSVQNDVIGGKPESKHCHHHSDFEAVVVAFVAEKISAVPGIGQTDEIVENRHYHHLQLDLEIAAVAASSFAAVEVAAVADSFQQSPQYNIAAHPGHGPMNVVIVNICYDCSGDCKQTHSKCSDYCYHSADMLAGGDFHFHYYY